MSLFRACVVFGALLATIVPAASQQHGNPLSDLLSMQMNWDASKSDDNAKPSPTLRFVLYDKQEQDGKTFSHYYVYAPGVPQNKPFALISWPIGWDAQKPEFQPSYSDLYVNARGVVMCRKPTPQEINSDAPQIESDARLDVIAAGSMGEPVRFALFTERDGIVAMGRIIVNPIEAEDKGCRLQSILAVGGAEVVLVEGTGFPDRSTVEITSESDSNPQTAKFKTDADGRFETPVVLMKQGLAQGTAILSAKSPACAPSVKFDWGHDTYKVQ
jgi:hypothetical protein